MNPTKAINLKATSSSFSLKLPLHNTTDSKLILFYSNFSYIFSINFYVSIFQNYIIILYGIYYSISSNSSGNL